MAQTTVNPDDTVDVAFLHEDGAVALTVRFEGPQGDRTVTIGTV